MNRKLNIPALATCNFKLVFLLIGFLITSTIWAQKPIKQNQSKGRQAVSASKKKNTHQKPVKSPLIPVVQDITVSKNKKTKAVQVPVPVQRNPEFPGGISAMYDYLNRNIFYPSAAKDAGIQGRVIVQFTVAEDGKIIDVMILKSLDAELDQEGLRLVKSMPKWNPGEQAGYPVKMKVVIPIIFKLNF